MSAAIVNEKPWNSALTVVSFADGALAYPAPHPQRVRAVVVSERWFQVTEPAHFTIQQDGVILQHADPAFAFDLAASRRGLVQVRLAVPPSTQGAWETQVDSPLVGRALVLPTLPQLEALARLLSLLGAALELPLQWCALPGLLAGRKPRGFVAGEVLEQGAGGTLPILYARLRIEAGHLPDKAMSALLWLARNAEPARQPALLGVAGLLLGAALLGLGIHLHQQAKPAPRRLSGGRHG
jgi:hypothetical protein